MENILDRLSKFMDVSNLNNNKITVKADLSNGLLGNAFKSGKGLNSDSIEKILYAYPNLNADWFVTGRGSMFNKEESNNLSIVSDSVEKYQNNTSKYIKQLEDENKRLISENQSKQEIIDSFLSGSIIVNKKDAV